MFATATVTFYSVIVFFHIAAVVIGFGPTFAYGPLHAVAGRDGLRATLGLSRALLSWNQTGLTASMVVVFLTGMYLAAYENFWELSDFFISWGFLAILALFAIVHGFFVPHERKLVAALEEEVAKPGGGEATEMPAAVATLVRPIARVGIATSLLLIVTIYFMTTKPFM